MIRPARADDAAAIAAIWEPIVRDTTITFRPDPYRPGEIGRLILDAPVFLVAEAEGRPAGFARAGTFRDGAGYRHTCEHTIHLAPEARGRGLGRALMAALEAAVVARGCHALVAGISAENAAGIAFHDRLGFAQVGRLPQVGRKFDRWIDLVLMQKLLSPGKPR